MAGLRGDFAVVLIVAQEGFFEAWLMRGDVGGVVLRGHLQHLTQIALHRQFEFTSLLLHIHALHASQRLDPLRRGRRGKCDLDDVMLEVFERRHLIYTNQLALTNDAYTDRKST